MLTRSWAIVSRMRSGILFLAVAAFLAAGAKAPAYVRTGVGPSFSSGIVIRAGRLWDGSKTINNATITIEDGKITSVASGRPKVAAGATEIDLSRYTVIPGLIDLHTHMTYYWDRQPGTRPLGQPRRTAAQTAELAADNARRTLETGVTTARDLGASGGADYLMRDAINTGRMTGPRLIVAGGGVNAGRGSPPETLAQAARDRVTAGSDWVKVYASRGSFQSVETTQTMTFDQMKAIVDAAHALGHKVAIHSYGASGVKDAVRAGADSVEHGIELDAETFAEMKRRGTVWVPTIDHNQYYVDAHADYGWADDVVPPLKDYIAKNLESTRLAFKAGVKIGMGSDAVYSGFGRNTGELGWFVKAGMKPAEALATATTIAADLLGMKDTLGRISPGFVADLVAVDGNPLAKIDALFTGVKLVIKDSKIVVDKR
ncbi:MAG: amidohydrolase family protein [Acidobacteria bacterium]|nr:MAG: amidohydrolase family protein [Acidobacteriota bacterium]